MSESQKLYEFTQVFGHALKLVKLANQVPEFVLSKARDINAQQTLDILAGFESDFELLKEIAAKNPDSKVSNDIDFETKKHLYDYIDSVKLAIENVKSPHFKLMIERYNSANELAQQVQTILEKLVLAEQEVKGIGIEPKEQ